MGFNQLLKKTNSLKPLMKKMFPTPQEKLLNTQGKILNIEAENRRAELEYKKRLLSGR